MAILLFLILAAVIFVLLITPQTCIKPKQRKFLIVGAVLLLAAITASIPPKADYDLARHYRDLNIIKYSPVSFKEYVLNSYQLTDWNYRYTYVFNIIRYVIAKYLVKEALPFLSVLICYGIFGYILYDMGKRTKFNNFQIAISIAASLCYLPILYVYSGVRNEMALAIMALVIYLKLYKDASWIAVIALTAIAATIHPMAIVALPFLFMSKIRPGKLGVILIVLIPTVLYGFMELMRFSSNNFLRYIGAKFYNYTFVSEYSQGSFFRTVAVIMTILTLLLSLPKVKGRELRDQRFANFVSWYCIFALANIASYQISMRLPQLLGILSPVIVNVLLKPKELGSGNKVRLKQLIIGGCIALMSVLAMFQSYTWMG